MLVPLILMLSKVLLFNSFVHLFQDCFLPGVSDNFFSQACYMNDDIAQQSSAIMLQSTHTYLLFDLLSML